MSEYNIQMNKYNALNAGYDQLYPATKIENVDGLNEALQNNDPRNWGLDVSKSLTDANDGTRNGFYTMTVGAANVPFDYGVLLVHNIGNPNFIHQELTEFLGGIKACRGGAWDDSISAIKWKPWEYVNPPMILGVEYRTTERYLGKPVYVKLVDFGNYPASGTKTVAHGISNVQDIVSCLGTSSLGYSVNGWSYVSAFYADKTNINIAVTGDFSKNQVKVMLKYTKTTD